MFLLGCWLLGFLLTFGRKAGRAAGKPHPQGAGEVRSLILLREELLRHQSGGAWGKTNDAVLVATPTVSTISIVIDRMQRWRR